MVWQALSDFRFRLAGGEIGPTIPKQFATGPAASTVDTLLAVYGTLPGEGSCVRAFVDDCVGEHVETEILDSQDWVNGLALVADRYQHGRANC